MPSPDYFVYEGDPANGVVPRRPTLADVGGGQKLNDENEPPDPITQPTAQDLNQMAMQFVALSRVAGTALIYVSNAGTPTINALRAASSLLQSTPVTTVGSVTTCGDFTITKHAVGDIELQCPANKIIPPSDAVAVTQAAGDFRATARLNGTGDGIRVETRDAAGTLSDVDFFVMWE